MSMDETGRTCLAIHVLLSYPQQTLSEGQESLMCNCALCPTQVQPISREGTGSFYVSSSCKPISQMSEYCGKRGRFAAQKDHFHSQQFQQWHSHFEPNLTEAIISNMCSCSLSNPSSYGSCSLRFFDLEQTIAIFDMPILCCCFSG